MSRRAPLAKAPVRPWVLACWVALAAAVAYCPMLSNGFTYDDPSSVVENPSLPLLTHPSTYFSHEYFTASDESTYRPLVSLSYGIEYRLWHKSAFGYHLVNLLLHVAATALLVPVCLSLGAPRSVSLVAGLLYAVHPLRSEAVCSVGFREDLICALFYFAAFALWPPFGRTEAVGVGAEPRPGPGRPVGEPPVAPLRLLPTVRLSLALAVFVLALLSKEMALSFPLLVLAKDLRGWRRGTPRAGEFAKRRLPWHIAAWLLTAAALFLFLTFHGPRAGFVYGEAVPLARRLAGFFWIAVRYLALFLFPYPLSADYVVDLRAAWILPAGILSALAFAVQGVFCFRRRESFPAAWHAFVAFFVLLGPVSNVIRLAHPMAERYLTLPMAALCYVTAHVLARWRAATPRRIFTAIVLAVLTLVSWQRCRDWRSEYTLWGHEVARGTDSALAYTDYAAVFLGNGQLGKAAEYLEQALRLSPDAADALSNLGGVRTGLGQYDEAEKALRRAIAIRPESGMAHANLASLLVKEKRFDEAARECEAALRSERPNTTVCMSVGNARALMGDGAGAEKAFRAAMALNPDEAGAASALGCLLIERGQFAEAISLFQSDLRLQPGRADSLEGLGAALDASNRLPEAAAAYSRLVAAHPEMPRAYLRLGTVLLRSGRRDEARRCLQQGLAAARRAGDAQMTEALRQALAECAK